MRRCIRRRSTAETGNLIKWHPAPLDQIASPPRQLKRPARQSERSGRRRGMVGLGWWHEPSWREMQLIGAAKIACAPTQPAGRLFAMVSSFLEASVWTRNAGK